VRSREMSSRKLAAAVVGYKKSSQQPI
jgi:hypothetical protein